MGIIYTSSSILIMDNAKVDLSRRQTVYTLYGLSFREYLAFEDVVHIDPVPFDELLETHVQKAMQIVKNVKIAPLFEGYLEHGYYPFYKEMPEDFQSRLRDAVSTVIDNDLPSVENVSFETIQKVRRLLMIISERVPFEPNMSELWKQLSTNNELGLRMLYALDKAQILTLLSSKVKNYKYLYKPDKIFLNNPNLMHVLCPRVDKGNERETFFASQLQATTDIKHSRQGDFLVADKYLFEVGGKNKTFDQIADMPDSYLAVDDTEIGHGCRIPLWLFGLTY